jgi:hypothetical protein
MGVARASTKHHHSDRPVGLWPETSNPEGAETEFERKDVMIQALVWARVELSASGNRDEFTDWKGQGRVGL